MTYDPKKLTPAFWLAVALLAVLAGYPLSFGPACWMCQYGRLDGHATWIAYRPVTLLWWYTPMPISNALQWWQNSFIPTGTHEIQRR